MFNGFDSFWLVWKLFRVFRRILTNALTQILIKLMRPVVYVRMYIQTGVRVLRNL